MERDCFYNELKYVRNYACNAAGLDPEIAGWKTAVDAMTKQLADAQATVEALQKKYDDLLGKYRQLMDFYDKHHGTPCEQIRHQQQVEALQRERDTLREATKVICGHCCEPMAIPSKAILQSQLSALQGLVRVYFTEPDPHKWTAAYQTLKRMGRALPATPTERGQDEK